ncbi:MAG: DNA translocase FtsK 4TM domain-containing protein [Alphaproteobacteria bacterium]
MARKYKIKTKKKNLLSRILPERLQSFFARRIIDTTGVSMVLTGLFILFSIISYAHTDPSFNSAKGTDENIKNWFGQAGANTADLLLQTFGIASAIMGLTLVVWGVSIFKRRPLPHFWSRIAALILAVFTGSIAFARIPAGEFLVQPYLGGSAGQIMFQKISDALHFSGMTNEFIITSAVFGTLTILITAFACALTKPEAKYIASVFWFWASSACLFVAEKTLGFYDWVRHYGNDEYEPKERLQRKSKPKIFKSDKAEKREVLERIAPVISAPQNTDMPSTGNIKVVAPQETAKSTGSSQTRFQLFDGGEWELPSIDLLQEIPDDNQAEQMDENALRMNAELLQNVLQDFNIQGEIVSIHPGPVVTLYELEPAPGTKSSRVIGLADDIARSMSAISVRAAVVPGRNVIGIEIPNKKRQTVYMREMLTVKEYEKSQAKLPLVLGKDIGGRPIIADLARMPHLLVAGTTGSGKSVAVNTMILSLLYALPPEKCRFIMIDPKMLELSCYDDIPHLLSPVVTEPGKAVVALKWLVAEMEERYRAMSKLGVRNIDGYNARLGEARKKGEALMRKVQTGFEPTTGKPVYEEQPLDLTDLPYIVVIVDEFADLMLVAGKDVEAAIQRLAQMARAAGIHIIMATQRPSVDVITGVIKANFPTRISFAVTSKIDSRTILGEGGAEQLLGMGDMLYMAAGGQITRVHGPFSSDADVENVVNHLKAQAEPSYLEEITEGGGDFTGEGLGGLYGDNEEKVDELYDQAVALVARERKASTSFVQRYLQIGYNRAARIVEEMERQGVISQANHVGKREVLVSDMSEAS